MPGATATVNHHGVEVDSRLGLPVLANNSGSFHPRRALPEIMSDLFDFAVITIFAREFLEGSIIIGEYRTIVLKGDALEDDVTKSEALREVFKASIAAIICALVVIACIAIPLALLSREFDNTTSNIIEGASKIVAAVCLLQLSLKLPKFLGIYGSCKASRRERSTKEETDDSTQSGSDENSDSGKLTLRNIRFNVAWNIWREVAECGVFLIPFFLSGENLEAIPLSAVVGSMLGLAIGLLIYYANQKLNDKRGLAVFAVLLLLFLSAGLFTGGCHKLEVEVGATKQVWAIQGKFWSVNRLPMTIFKPFGYNNTRTVLEICCYWLWLIMGVGLHYRKYRRAVKLAREEDDGVPAVSGIEHFDSQGNDEEPDI